MAFRLTVAASCLMIERHMKAEKIITSLSGSNSFSQFRKQDRSVQATSRLPVEGAMSRQAYSP